MEGQGPEQSGLMVFMTFVKITKKKKKNQEINKINIPIGTRVSQQLQQNAARIAQNIHQFQSIWKLGKHSGFLDSDCRIEEGLETKALPVL